MNKFLYGIALFAFTSCGSSGSLFNSSSKPKFVELETTKGDIIVKLYNETPLHKENFLKLAKEGYYDGVIFHRVINDFMIQTGDPDSKNAEPNKSYGSGGPDYKIPAEFNSSLFHKKGALAAARNNNPEKKSSGSQFYIVEGEVQDKNFLEMIQERNNISYTEEQIETYTTIGGTPFLDNNYTVFGEVVKGLDVVEKISDVKTKRQDRPVEDIKIISTKIVKFKEKNDKR